jgi:hypothetical protein
MFKFIELSIIVQIVYLNSKEEALALKMKNK